jgi:hemin uptake protein HemP
MNTYASASSPEATLVAKLESLVVATEPLRVDSTALMGGQRVLEIVHLGEVYRLQTTRLGKLILTK